MLADVAQELEQRVAAQPLAVVDHDRAWPSPAREVDEALRAARGSAALFASIVASSSRLRSALLPDGSPIMPVPPPMSDDRRAAGALEVRQQEDLHEVAHVERRAGRVEADVGADRAAREARLEALGARLQQAAPAELGEEAGGVGHQQHSSRTEQTSRPMRQEQTGSAHCGPGRASQLAGRASRPSMVT